MTGHERDSLDPDGGSCWAWEVGVGMDARCGTWFPARLRVGMGPSRSLYTDLIERTAEECGKAEQFGVATLAVDLEQVASSQSKPLSLLFLFTIGQVTGPFKKALPIFRAWNRVGIRWFLGLLMLLSQGLEESGPRGSAMTRFVPFWLCSLE